MAQDKEKEAESGTEYATSATPKWDSFDWNIRGQENYT